MDENLKIQTEITTYIYNDMMNKVDWLETNHPELNIIFMVAKGSMNYDMMVFTKDYQSDVDVEVAVCPSLDDIIRGNKMISTTYVMDDNSHICVRDIRLFKDLLYKQNLAFLELLHSNYYLMTGLNEMKLLTKLQQMSNDIDKIDQTRFFKALKGMMYEKQKALTHPYPTQAEEIEKYGYANKQLHHILRLHYIVEDMIKDGKTYKDCLVLPPSIRAILILHKTDHIDCNIAISLANKKVSSAKELIDNYLKENKFEINQDIINQVDNIIYEYIKENIILTSQN